MNNIDYVHVEITKPMAMTADVNMKNLNMITGTNGTGKTFLLVNMFCITTIAQLKGNPQAKEAAQFIYDNSFDDQNIDGKVLTKFTNGGVVEIEFKEGKIDRLLITADNVPPIKYMSAQMRTFDDMLMYIKIRKQYKGKSQEEIVQGMLEVCKLYDVMYIEQLIARCPISISAEENKKWQDDFHIKETITEINVDLDKGFFAKLQDSTTKYLTTFSKGEQSMINMFIGAKP